MVDGSQKMTSKAEQIQDDAVHREEALRVGGGRELSHLSLALAGRLVRHLRTIVLILPRAMYD